MPIKKSEYLKSSSLSTPPLFRKMTFCYKRRKSILKTFIKLNEEMNKECYFMHLLNSIYIFLENGFGEDETCRQFIYIFLQFYLHILAINETRTLVSKIALSRKKVGF